MKTSELQGAGLDWAVAKCAELEKALPTCDEHKPRGGARATCIICACEKLSGALSQISYLCGPPNELEVSEYDTHYDEQLVVEQVRKRIAELEAERDSYKAMVKEQWASAIPEGMVLVKLKNMMALRDALVEKDHDEAPLPDDVAKMVERLRNDHDRNYEDEAADMLERQQRRIAELEAQREGMVLVPMEPTEGIREVIRNEHGAYGSEDELYSALIAAATKED